jgi:CRP-like cAMP-binding protein
MKYDYSLPGHDDHLFARFSIFATIEPESGFALQLSAAGARSVAAGQKLVLEGEPEVKPTILLRGWGYRAKLFADGRRQILSFLLPGDVIGTRDQRCPSALSTIVALTDLTFCAAPAPLSCDDSLEHAYAASNEAQSRALLRQIARLGRMSAVERLADFVLEMHERLSLCGLANGASFPMPVTQDMLADVLGFTSVHVNRTLQQFRREKLLELRSGRATLLDQGRLATLSMSG